MKKSNQLFGAFIGVVFAIPLIMVMSFNNKIKHKQFTIKQDGGNLQKPAAIKNTRVLKTAVGSIEIK